jgi:thiamine biosynthesis protein ThiC
LEKLHTSIHYGADTVMDLSTGRTSTPSARRSSQLRPCPSAPCPCTRCWKSWAGASRT